MAEKRYRVTGVNSSYWSLAARYAVLRPILNVADVGDEACPHLLDKLRTAWCSRIGSLHAADWEPVQDHRTFLGLRACPPFGVKTDTRGRPCGFARVCPFCYARRNVFEPFFRMVWGCYGTLQGFVQEGDKQEHVKPLDATLIEFSTALVFTRPEAAVPEIVRYLEVDRRVEVDQVQCHGAVVIHTIEAFPEHYVLYRRGLILVPHDQELDPMPDTTVTVHRQVNRKVLAESLGRVARYPARMIHGRAADTLAIMAATERVKLLLHYGNFRNRAEREQAPAAEF